MPKLRKKHIIYLLVALAVLVGMMHGGPMWTKVSSTFMKQDKPYGPGDFRIRGDQVVSMKLSKPETKTKPMTKEQLADPNSRLEYTEQWMYSVNERRNRRSVHIFSGTLENPQRTFEERAQKADWWLAPDWSTAYLTTGWTNSYDIKKGVRYAPQITKLFKSTNQGLSWEQLEWPENQNITYLRFLDPQRGYLIGWGPRIWRTTDGGSSWTEISIPEQARDPEDERAEFDLVALGKDGVLRFAFLVRDTGGNHSQVHTLRWNDTEPKLAFTLPEQTVMDIADDGEGRLYILSQTGLPPYWAAPDAAPRQSQVLIRRLGGVDVMHTFDAGFTGYALYLTPSKALLVDGVDESGLLPKDVIALSRDGGRTWKVESEGLSAQGGYYDTQTGTRWRVSGYSLYRREIP
ncbi:WD40/YVTN/BNR-like repeat-containing protein [Alcaligenes sp. SDU_A2]|uniref:WD40/YVTN/BNR-like repeat-containing protein n=1 Tax=Alcaligenes sp. SDU_A2 TaxID=3136634 RepID=UPI00311F1BFD